MSDGGAGGWTAPTVSRDSVRRLVPGVQRAALLSPLTELRELGPYLLLSKYQFHFPLTTN